MTATRRRRRALGERGRAASRSVKWPSLCSRCAKRNGFAASVLYASSVPSYGQYRAPSANNFLQTSHSSMSMPSGDPSLLQNFRLLGYDLWQVGHDFIGVSSLCGDLYTPGEGAREPDDTALYNCRAAVNGSVVNDWKDSHSLMLRRVGNGLGTASGVHLIGWPSHEMVGGHVGGWSNGSRSVYGGVPCD